MIVSATPNRKLRARRVVVRDALWADADTVVFSPLTGGWAQIPRTVPMVAGLIDTLGGRENAGRLYVVLWAYQYGDGFVEVPDPAQLALEAGYMSTRAERTFDERVALLARLGFVRTAENGLRDHGFVLLLDPHRVVARIRAEQPKKIPGRWWSAFQARCSAVGVPLTITPSTPASEPQANEDTKPDPLEIL